MFIPDDFSGNPPAVYLDHQQPAEADIQENRIEMGSGKLVSEIDERKRRRMISNRESARRSRVRKQRHLDELRCLVNQLRLEKRQMLNRLGMLDYLHHQILLDTCRLRSEHADLSQKLAELRQILDTLTINHLKQLNSSPFPPSSLKTTPYKP